MDRMQAFDKVEFETDNDEKNEVVINKTKMMSTVSCILFGGDFSFFWNESSF